MTVQTMKRGGLVLMLATLISGCSMGDGRSNECWWNRSACMYEGSYEPGEEGYAEEEAQRLNREAASRARRW